MVSDYYRVAPENGPRIVRSRRSARQIRSDYSKSAGIRMTFLGHLLTQVPQPVHLDQST